MGDVLACVFLSNFPVFQMNGAWVRAVVKTNFDSRAIQNIIAIFSQPVAEKFGDEDLVLSMLGFHPQDCPFWRRVNLIGDLRKNRLGKFDYFSKMSCSFLVQSSIPLWQNSQSAKSASHVLLTFASTCCTKSMSSLVRLAKTE